MAAVYLVSGNYCSICCSSAPGYGGSGGGSRSGDGSSILVMSIVEAV